MAEQSIVVCDVCGTPAHTTVSIKADGKSVHKDLCSDHLGELLQGSRRARPGRRRSVASAPKRASAGARTGRGASKKATARSSAKKSTAKAASRRARRPRRTPKAQEAPAGAGQEDS